LIAKAEFMEGLAAYAIYSKEKSGLRARAGILTWAVS